MKEKKDVNPLNSRITLDEKIMPGKPVIRGVQITVEILLKKFSQSLSAEKLIEEYPQLEKEDIKSALLYAAKNLTKY